METTFYFDHQCLLKNISYSLLFLNKYILHLLFLHVDLDFLFHENNNKLTAQC